VGLKVPITAPRSEMTCVLEYVCDKVSRYRCRQTKYLCGRWFDSDRLGTIHRRGRHGTGRFPGHYCIGLGRVRAQALDPARCTHHPCFLGDSWASGDAATCSALESKRARPVVPHACSWQLGPGQPLATRRTSPSGSWPPATTALSHPSYLSQWQLASGNHSP
jgi:hypothetical protein